MGAGAPLWKYPTAHLVARAPGRAGREQGGIGWADAGNRWKRPFDFPILLVVP